MERQPTTSLIESTNQFIQTSDKKIQSSHSKMKNISSSTHRRMKQCSSAIIQRMKKMSHAHKNSTAKRNKNKCQTEAHQSAKKRNTDHTSLSKKTLQKRKNTRAEEPSKLKLSHSKYQQQALTLKSSGKRSSTKKQMFHSTCFSRRHIDQNLQIMEQFLHANSQFLPHSMTNPQSLLSPAHQTQLQCILQRASSVFSAYKTKYKALQKSCNYYRTELETANKKLAKFQTANSKQNGIKSKSKPKQRIRQNKDTLRTTYCSRFNEY